MKKDIQILTNDGKWFRLCIAIPEDFYFGIFSLPATPIDTDIDLDNYTSRDYESKPSFHFTRPLHQVLSEFEISLEEFNYAVERARVKHIKEML